MTTDNKTWPSNKPQRAWYDHSAEHAEQIEGLGLFSVVDDDELGRAARCKKCNKRFQLAQQKRQHAHAEKCYGWKVVYVAMRTQWKATVERCNNEEGAE